LPQHVVAPAGTVEHATEDEEQIGEAVEVLAWAITDRFFQRQRDQRAFGAAAYGTGVVGERRGAVPPGRMKSLSGGSASLKPSSASSRRVTCLPVIMLMPGMHTSPPRSNKSCWTSVSSVRTSSGSASHSSRPTTALVSSTSPRAWMRRLFFDTRLPSPRPVVPASPVRV